MDRFRFALPLLSLVTLLAVTVASTSAQCCRKTLMQWSYGTSFEGGPKLDEPLVSDRPDFTESPVTVGLGVMQVELGYAYTADSDDSSSSHSHSYPQTLLRLGTLAEWFELRIGWNYGNEHDTEFGGPVDSLNGAEDLGIGFKIALTPQECCLPETGILVQTTVPTGSSDFSADEMLPGVAYLYAWDVTDFFSTGGETQINRAADGDTGDFYALFAQSWTSSQSWTDDVSTFAEWFCLVPCGADTDHTQHYFDGGFTVLLNDNLQWDIEAGIGLNSAAEDYFVGSGLSVRFK
jgi:hypothetical protein